MSKSSNFFGQPIYGQLIKSLDREKIVEISRKHGGEKYIKSFDGFTHLLTMLYAVIQRFDSLREIETAMTAEVRKLHHVGIKTVPRRSTLSDANARRPESFFEEVYRYLYDVNKGILSSDSRRNGTEEWIKQLRIIDSTTISLFPMPFSRVLAGIPRQERRKVASKCTRSSMPTKAFHAMSGLPRRPLTTLSCSPQAITATTRYSLLTVHISTTPNSRNLQTVASSMSQK